MKLLVLGSEGFIGSHLINYFLAKKWQVHGVDLYETGNGKYPYQKITRLSPEYDELLTQIRFDVCINAAGSANVGYSMSHPVSDFESNCLDTIRILDGLRKRQLSCRYIHISSAAVYGMPSELPIAENHAINPISSYGWHKAISEQLCKEYCNLHNVPIVILRPFSVYGPGLRKQLFWDLFQKGKANAQTPLELWGTGDETRDFIYIEDVLKAFEIIISKAEFKCEAYNIACGVETKIKDAVSVFFRAMKIDREFYFNGSVRSGDPANWKANINKLESLGFQFSYDLDQGLNQVAGWLSRS